jgi:phosphatidylinositol glycan class M
MLVYGLWQDANSPLKYTDIDYLVFTDAARFAFSSPLSSASTEVPGSPYTRETYRYTPLLAWMLYPTTLPGTFWFSSGKVLFAASDLAAGWLIVLVLRRHMAMPMGRALRYSSIWLLNPMVATISTRGSSEGLLGVLVMALLYAVLEKRVTTAGLLLGLGVHFKIYPFVYAPAIVWWMDAERMGRQFAPGASFLRRFVTPDRVRLGVVSLATFMLLNVGMYALYGQEFLQHTFFHHVTRIDHRHNFSPYNVLLYLTSARPYLAANGVPRGVGEFGGLGIESVAFVPQLLLSCILIPLVGAKKDLAATMLAQTFAFVTFNKVCTSQVCTFLPLHPSIQHPLPPPSLSSAIPLSHSRFRLTVY